MRSLLRRNIPSMFHRRLLLLVVGGFVVCCVLGLRMAHLTTGAEHERRLAQAESALENARLIPTVRGVIMDREDRELAIDEPGYDVAVSFSVISGRWARDRAEAAARKAMGEQWGEMSPLERDEVIFEYRKPFDRQVQMLWEELSALGQVDRDIIAEQRNTIVRRVHQMASHLYLIWQKQRSRELGEPVTLAQVAKPIGPELEKHSILRDVTSQMRMIIESLITEAQVDPALAVWSEVRVERPRQRRYPLETMTVMVDRSTLPGPLRHAEPIEITVEGVASHFIGQMRDVWREDTAEPGGRPFRTTDAHGEQVLDLGGYLPGDRVGSFGIEQSMEHYLRGTRGREIINRATDQRKRIDPQPGRDVRLTLDIQLQAHIQAMMSPHVGLMRVQPWSALEQDPQNPLPGILTEGDPLAGAAVVLEIETGHVLAAVSVPSMPLRLLAEDPGAIFNDHVHQPWINRPVAMPYQPGSTVKPLVLVAAATAGVHDLGHAINCTGHLFENNTGVYRCWIYLGFNRTHGPLLGPEAVARSCNLYFYTLGRDMGARQLAYWYDLFGVGRTTGSGVPDEIGGFLPDYDDGRTTDATGLMHDAINMGIGQGPIGWTPLQAANAYATLLRGGVAVQPTLIQDEHLDEPRRPTKLQLNPEAVRQAIQGLDEGVNKPYGTGRNLNLGELGRERLFNVEGVHIIGKSGTAQTAPLRADGDGDGRITSRDPIVKSGNHAWFIAAVRPEDQQAYTHVIVVVVDHGGSGGQVAGPVVNQIIHILRGQGYL